MLIAPQDEIKKSYVKIAEDEAKALDVKMTKAQAQEMALHEKNQQEQKNILHHSSNTLSAAQPSRLSNPTLRHPNIFNPPPLYHTLVLPETKKSIAFFRWSDFFNTTVEMDEYNYLADKIILYFEDDKAAMMNFALTSSTTLEVYKFYKARQFHSTNIQTLRRCQLARREMALRRLLDKNARLLERVTRGMLGRMRFNAMRHELQVNEALKSKLGGKAEPGASGRSYEGRKRSE